MKYLERDCNNWKCRVSKKDLKPFNEGIRWGCSACFWLNLEKDSLDEKVLKWYEFFESLLEKSDHCWNLRLSEANNRRQKFAMVVIDCAQDKCSFCKFLDWEIEESEIDEMISRAKEMILNVKEKISRPQEIL